jgi:hypothetical protein
MNERIKELEQQCWGYRVDGILVDGQLHFDVPKFAELIVRECMRMCDCADVSYLEHGCDKEASGAAGAKEIIKEWFEVEE